MKRNVGSNMIYLRFLLLSVVHVSLYAQSADPAASTEQSQLFKIGFEFQESHHMCPWAIEAPEIQSIPIFSVCQGDRVLWDLTIDWQDLEFVTMPITNNELDILKITMCSIQIACNALVELNEKAKHNFAITFHKWITSFSEKLKNNYTSLGISAPTIKVHNINAFCCGSFCFPVGYGERFDFKFKPQVTIQHHLMDSINLCLGLFINGINYGKDVGVVDTTDNAFPRYLNDFILNTNLFTKKEKPREVYFPVKTDPKFGFLFLHMLTCTDLAHDKPPEEVACGDLNINSSTYQTRTMCLLHFGTGQVNAKSSVNFLSRRPFSSMWRDIATDLSYASFLSNTVTSAFLDDLTTKFDQMNYGEIFFTDAGERMDLTQCEFAPRFEDPNIQALLQNGILSLEFIRAVDPAFLQNYFAQVVKSVSNPEQTKRCVFDKKTKTLNKKRAANDLLSAL